MNQQQLFILKISGESFKQNDNIIGYEFLINIANQIKYLNNYYQIAIVLGGGNIWRGKLSETLHIPKLEADQMGMIATMINSIALQVTLKKIGVNTKIFSTIEMEKVADNYIVRNIKNALNNNIVAILACGTGRPFFTTDTGIAVSGAELNASYILMGKNNVDGVYDSDPLLNKDAKFFNHLTYQKMIDMNLKVMDLTAASICMQTNIKTIVFRINTPNGIINTLKKQNKFTLISKDESDLITLKFKNLV